MTEKMSRPRAPRPALPSAPTWQFELTPAFKEALRAVAPKPRRRVLRYVLALGLVAGIAVFAFGAPGSGSASAAQIEATSAVPEAVPETLPEPPPVETVAADPAPPSEPAPVANCMPPSDDKAVAPASTPSEAVAPMPKPTEAVAPTPSVAAKKTQKTPRKPHRRAHW
jgi:hypothetical protein